MKKSPITSLVLIAALVSASNGTALRMQTRGSAETTEQNLIGSDSVGELREEFHQTYPLAANGRVSVDNLNGGVRIGVWDRNDVQVDAVKRAYKQERLDEAKIEVSASAESIRIKTNYPDRDQNFTYDQRGRLNNPATVDYSITVPRRARLESIDLVNGSLEVDGVEGDVKASSVNGRMVARGLLGVAKLSTVNGGLEASFANLDPARAISLNSVNGPVLILIPSDSNAIVKASTVHGAISNEFGLDVQNGDYVGHELYGQLGSGGPQIRLGNVNGRIVIKHAQDGRALSPATGLLQNKDKDKEKFKDNGVEGDEDQNEQDAANMTPEARRDAAAARRAERVEAARVTRETRVEVQREVERALRDAQREIEVAQRQVQRETERQVRVQVRREARGEGLGKGNNEGRGAGRGTGSGEYTDRESKSFPVSGNPNVNVVTFDGAVTVHGWDKPVVMYAANKRADDPQELKQISIQTEQQGSSVSIIAKSYEDNGTVSLDVYLPRNATLHVSSGDGSLNLEGVSGDLTLRTGDGSIEVSDGHGQLQVNTGDGSIRVEKFEGGVDARTGDGSITLAGRFNTLAARTGDGSISLAVPANSDFTIETNAEDVDNGGLNVSEDVAASKRVRRWKVGRGGTVFVLNTGNGKIILQSR
ncbi:MAG: DUF4097 family beta strand repeat-containing protein [bacterium]